MKIKWKCIKILTQTFETAESTCEKATADTGVLNKCSHWRPAVISQLGYYWSTCAFKSIQWQKFENVRLQNDGFSCTSDRFKNQSQQKYGKGV